MRWHNVLSLYLLLLSPVLVFLYFQTIKIREELVARLGAKAIQAAVKQAVSLSRRHAKNFLLIGAFFFLVLAVAGPQVATRQKKVQKVGSEVLVALDTSLSMLAEDEHPSRLEKGKEITRAFLERLEGYKVGLLIFAATSFVQCPLTLDRTAIRYFLDLVDSKSLPVQGSVLEKTVELAGRSFGTEPNVQKTLILISDGEDQEGDPLVKVRETRRKNIRIFTIGVGYASGAPIPLREGGVLVGYKKDADGVVVSTHLNDSLLTAIAQEGGGRYFHASREGSEVEQIVELLAKSAQKKAEEVERHYETKFQLPLFLALLMLAGEMVLSEQRKP